MTRFLRTLPGARRRALSCVLALGAVSLAGVAGAAPLAAQATIYKPQQLDPERQRIRDGLLVMRDTLRAVEAAAARFNIDPRGATPSLTLSRLRRMRQSCQAAQRQLGPTRELVSTVGLQGAQYARARQSLVASMAELRATLERCDTQFVSLSAPERRADARFDAIKPALKVQQDIQRYETVLDAYFKAAEIEVRPLGAGRSPLDG